MATSPPERRAVFQFLGDIESAATYTFQVEQTYSDGSVADWAGDEGSDEPAPTLEAVDSLGAGSSGDGDSDSTLAIAALIVGGLGAVLGGLALARGSGRKLA